MYIRLELATFRDVEWYFNNNLESRSNPFIEIGIYKLVIKVSV